MVATLPRNIQLKLEQTLKQWHQWRCDPPLSALPRVLQVFCAGISNHSVLVEAGKRYVVRIDGVHASNNNLARATEWRVLKMAHAAGLAPCPRYYNPELGALVCDYLPADPPGSARTQDTAALLRNIHSLPAIHHRLDLRERIVRYEKQLLHQNKPLSPVMDTAHSIVLPLLDKLDARKVTPVLCHNDLLAANRISSDQHLWAIDWEYCAMGSCWYDLAVVAVGDKLGAKQIRLLLHSYLARELEPQELLTFSRYCMVYRYLEILWFQANAASPEDHEDRLSGLRRALSRGNY